MPSSLGDTMKRKELRKLLAHFIKINSNLGSASTKGGVGDGMMTALQAKLHYLKIIINHYQSILCTQNVEKVAMVPPLVKSNPLCMAPPPSRFFNRYPHHLKSNVAFVLVHCSALSAAQADMVSLANDSLNRDNCSS